MFGSPLDTSVERVGLAGEQHGAQIAERDLLALGLEQRPDLDKRHRLVGSTVLEWARSGSSLASRNTCQASGVASSGSPRLLVVEAYSSSRFGNLRKKPGVAVGDVLGVGAAAGGEPGREAAVNRQRRAAAATRPWSILPRQAAFAMRAVRLFPHAPSSEPVSVPDVSPFGAPLDGHDRVVVRAPGIRARGAPDRRRSARCPRESGPGRCRAGSRASLTRPAIRPISERTTTSSPSPTPSRRGVARSMNTASRPAPVSGSIGPCTIELNCLPRRVERRNVPARDVERGGFDRR